MPNSSNKNFPHAYGAGRVIAAFRLAHSGGPFIPGDANEIEEVGGVPPAALEDSAIVASEPYPWPEGFPWGPADLGSGFLPAPYARGNWQALRMPYNATNFGVYAVGSGTESFPYRDMILQATTTNVPEIDDYYNAPGAYPFKKIQEFGLGTSNAQYVQQVFSDETSGWEGGEAARYMVALNWNIPDSIAQYTVPSTGWPADPGDVAADVDIPGWAAREQNTVTKALKRSCWCVATPSRYQYEVNPLFQPLVDESSEELFRIAPQLFGSQATIRPEATPDWAIQSDANPAPFFDSDPFDLLLQPVIDCSVRSTVSANVTRVAYEYVNNNGPRLSGAEPWEEPLPGDQLRWTQSYQAVVNIEVLTRTDPEDNVVSPRPLPWFFGEVATAVNVVVLQKNSAAPDGTDGGMYAFIELPSAPTSEERSGEPASYRKTITELSKKPKKEAL